MRQSCNERYQQNDFEVNPGEDWDDKKSDETIKYMTGKRNMETFVKMTQ